MTAKHMAFSTVGVHERGLTENSSQQNVLPSRCFICRSLSQLYRQFFFGVMGHSRVEWGQRRTFWYRTRELSHVRVAMFMNHTKFGRRNQTNIFAPQFAWFYLPTAQLFLQVVPRQKLLFLLYPAAAGGGETKQRETFRLPSTLFSAPPPPGPQTNWKASGRWEPQ